MLDVLINVLTPVLIAIAIGFGWSRRGLPWNQAMVTGVVMNVGTPCLAFHAIATLPLDPAAIAEVGLAFLVVIVGFGVLGALALRLLRRPVLGYLPALTFPNTGNLGLPLCLFAFGEAGLGLAIVCFSVVAFGHFTFGMAAASARWSFRPLLTSAPLYGLLAGAIVLLGELSPPDVVFRTTELLGGLTIPLALMALGASLSHLDLTDARAALVLGILRVVLGLAVGAAVVTLFGLEGVARGVVLLQAVMPSAVFNYMLAQRFGGPARPIAGMIMVSTALSLVIVAVLLPFLQ